MPRTFHLALAVIVIIAFVSTAYVFAGFVPAVVFTVASSAGWCCG